MMNMNNSEHKKIAMKNEIKHKWEKPIIVILSKRNTNDTPNPNGEDADLGGTS